MSSLTENENNIQLERVIVVSPYVKSPRKEQRWKLPLLTHATESTQELIALLHDAGAKVCASFSQEIKNYTAATIIGKGKINEVERAVQAENASCVVFNGALSPSQQTTLSELFDCKVMDRSGVIIDIFSLRAKSSEGKLQVELAFLEYNKSRLSGFGTELSQQGAGIGTRGPGETKLELDQRKITNRIRILTRKLKGLEKTRHLHRKRRKKNATSQIALVGYTNAGKSAMMQRLTKSDTYIQDQLFATLDTTTNKLRLPNGSYALLTDTVGFMQDLPHQLIKAFHATFEEILEAELWLHIVDVSDQYLEHKYDVVTETVALMTEKCPRTILVLNKSDLLEGEDGEKRGKNLVKHFQEKTECEDVILCSCTTGRGIDLLQQAIEKAIQYRKE